MNRDFFQGSDSKSMFFPANAVTWLTLWITCGILVGTGCTSVEYMRIQSQQQDQEASGIRYYDTSTYILVQRDTNSNWASSVLYLPDLTKKNQVNINTFLAANTTSMVFTNGILGNTSTTADSSAVPAALVQVASQAAISMAKAAGEETSQLTNSAVFFFKVIKVNHQWGVVGASAPDLSLISFGP
jgi:hypothetical protein